MKIPFRLSTKTSALGLIGGLAAVVIFCGTTAVGQVKPAMDTSLGKLDLRAPSAQSAADLSARQQGEAQLRDQVPLAVVDYDPLIGSPKFIRAQQGFLTGPNGQGGAVSASTAQLFSATDPYLAVKAFVAEHAALFGHGAEALDNARITRDDIGAKNGLRTVVWEQQLDGIPVFEGVFIGNVSRMGELVSVSSRFVASPSRSADAGTQNRQALQNKPSVSAEQAIIVAAQSLGDTLSSADLVSVTSGNSAYLAFRGPKGAIQARLVWFPFSGSAMRLGWEVFLFSQTVHEKFQVVIAADTSEVLLRRNVTFHISPATYNVYTSDSPSPFSPGWPTPNTGQPALVNRTMVTIDALSPTASPNGWINDGDNTTTGNNTDVFVDRNFDQQPDGPRPTGVPDRVFDFPMDLTNDPLVYSNAAVVQMFYWVNWYHDKLYDLGFTEAAGNYQQDNFGRGGLGNDSIIAYVQAGADVGLSDNAFFSPAPDGFNGQIAMFTWSGPNPDRDGDFDADVIMHEATHGTSTRLVGGGVGLNSTQGGGMGEGWSDFYALSLLSAATDDPDAVYAAGGYASYLLGGLTQNYYFGIRHYPYSTDMGKNPFTFKDIDPTQVIPHTGVPRSPIYPFNPQESSEVHFQGEVWCTTLWEVRAKLIHKYGGAVGNQLALQLVTDGMKLCPVEPNFVQSRDAIILADQIDNGGANASEIWSGFAKRGLGISATAPDSSTTTGVHEAFDLPGVQIVSTNLPTGNGNGAVDPNECNALYVTLKNLGAIPATTVTATLFTTNEHLIITGRSSSYPNIVPGTTVTNQTAFQFSTSPGFVCGTIVKFGLILKADQFTQTNFFQLASGSPGTPIRFDNSTPVSIPDKSSADSTIFVTNFNTAVLKATVAVHITHTYDSDLLLQLISPDGVTNVLAANVGGSGNNFGTSCADGSRTVFDDSATTSISLGAAPFLGLYRPAQPLSVYVGKTGTNVNGLWRLHVVDQATLDTGRIECWSLFLTPPTCTDGGGECPGSDLAISGSAAPEPVIVGNNLVYTITIRNRGPKTAKGVTLTQILPASVVYVSGTISQGSISSAGGTVNGNIGNVPADGVVTATITVLPTQNGTITSTASVAAVADPDPDLSNNSITLTSHVSPPTSDLAIGMVGSANPVLMGSILTYTISVTNNGPSAATGVVVSNALPATVSLISANASQGSTSVGVNVVLFNLGSLNVGAVATATISVIPQAQGQITATAKATANQFDPLPANSSASVTTSVTPASDLAVGFSSVPGAIVFTNNPTYLTYTIRATNNGPSFATGVLISQTLPTNATYASATNDAGGVISHTGNLVTCDLDNTALTNGAIVTMSVKVSFAAVSTNTSTVTISGALADPIPANNSASAITVVAPPFVDIQPLTAMVTNESFLPPNGSIEAGETVTVYLSVANFGNVATTNLMAKLLATGGVTSPTAATRVYGAIASGGFSSPQPFSFTAAGTNGGTVTATLQLSGDKSNTVSFVFGLEKSTSFANSNLIVIPDGVSNTNTVASPYPSTILVSGVTGQVGRVTATLSNLNHSYPHDVSVLLVSPTGASALLMSQVADVSSASGLTITFDDSAAFSLPSVGSISSGSWKPTAYNSPLFPQSVPPATNVPAGPYTSTMSAFSGLNPNGVWSLFVMDNVTGDGGGISNGWSLAITTVTPVNNVADLSVTGVGSPNPVLVGDVEVNTFTIVNNSTNAASQIMFTNVFPANVTLISTNASSGGTIVSTTGGKVVAMFPTLGGGATATVTVMMSPTAGGSLNSTGIVAAAEADLVPINNVTVVSSTANVPLADVSIFSSGVPSPAVLGSNLVYTLVVTNAGPQNALNAVVTNAIPSALTFLSSSTGVFANGTLTCNLGTLAAGATVVINVTNRAISLGTITNTVAVATSSSDTNSANNTSSVVTVIRSPVANILAAGAKLVAEGASPKDGTVDPGETVTVSLTLTNSGEINTANLVATLLSTGGVTSPSGAANYGVVAHGGAAVTRDFTFTASPSATGVITATLQLNDNANNLGTVAFTFALPQTTAFANTNAIIIPDHGPAAPYPATISVSGTTGVVSKVVVTLKGVTHTFPHDIGVLLVAPSGAKAMVMSGVGGSHSVSNLNLTFDDAAGSVLSESDQIVSGTFLPTANLPGKTFPAPASAVGSTTSLMPFRGSDPNGTWALYVVDDASGDAGVISAGWSLAITTVTPAAPVADVAIAAVSVSPSPAYSGVTLTYTFAVTNKGPATATSVVVTNRAPDGSVTVSSIGTLNVGAATNISFNVVPSVAGSATNAASVSASETDLNTLDNTASLTVNVLNLIRPQLSGVVVSNQFRLTLVGQPDMTYVIQASTNLTSWTTIRTTNTPVGSSTLQFIDTGSVGVRQRFYRAIATP